MRSNYTKNVTGLRFISISLISIVMLMLIYVISLEYILTGQNHDIPTSYNEFLLDNTPHPRIVVDSGSNSLFGIDPMVFEKAFSMPAISIADNINHPIWHKFEYLTRYAEKGDIIVLPIEWVHYTNRPYYSQYTESILSGRANYYIHNLSLTERLYVYFRVITINSYLSALLKYFNRDTVTEIVDDYEKKLQKNDGNSLGGLITNWRKHPDTPYVQNSTCDTALFDKFEIGEQFIDALEILEQAKQKGATIIFTWPVAVDKKGDTCYRSERVKEMLPDYVKKIRATLTERGFLVAGELFDSVFSSEHFHDNYYHITGKAIQQRTEKLANRIKELGVNSAGSRNYTPGDSIKELRKTLHTSKMRNIDS